MYMFCAILVEKQQDIEESYIHFSNTAAFTHFQNIRSQLNQMRVHFRFQDRNSTKVGSVWGDKELYAEKGENAFPHFLGKLDLPT